MTRKSEGPDVGRLAAAMLLNNLHDVAQGTPGHTVMDASQLRRHPAMEGALDAAGNLLVHPAAFWAEYSQTEISYFCNRFGFYCIPTTELVDWLKERIAGRSAIEIGSGSGVLAAALQIPATDNRQQEWPEMARAYRSGLGVAPIKYGSNVLAMDAAIAVKRYKPQVVIGAWITHRFRPSEDWRKGNQYGVEEEKLIQRATYIHIGHTRVHEAKPILEVPHGEIDPPWLVSRATSAGRNYICWWGE